MSGVLRVFLLLLLPGLYAFAEPLAGHRDPSTATMEAELPDGDESLAAAQAALAAASTESAALQALAIVVNLHRRRGDYTAGLVGAREGLERAQSLGNASLQVEFLYLLGRIYWNLTDYPHSLEMHLEELRLSRTLDDPFLLARTHGGLGLTYQRFGRNEDALHHFELGLAQAARAPDERMRGSLLNSLGSYHLSRGEHRRATALFTDALAIRERSGNARAIAETLTNLGLAADGEGDLAGALTYLRRALATFEALKYRRSIANTQRRLASVLRHAGQIDQALASLDAAQEVASTLDSSEVMADIWLEYALTHEARREYAVALDYQRRYAAASEEVRGGEDRRRMAELRALYGEEQRELEIALLKRGQDLQRAELGRRRSQNFALIAGMIGGVTLLGAIIVVQVVRLRSEKRLHAATEHARERAEAAERLKSRLLQMASHDLKVPLNALHATASLIARAPDDSASVQRHAAGIQADTARMRTLVRDFLDASAIEDGNLLVQPSAIDLVEVVRQTAASLHPVASQKDQQLRLVLPESALPAVRADAERLRQVFDNLIGNALKFTPSGGVITLGFGETGPWAYAEVRDNGPGLGPTEFARIFAPRQPASARTTHPAESDSTGLGLFIVRELLTMQGGRLEVESQPGRGAVFRVLLSTAPL